MSSTFRVALFVVLLSLAAPRPLSIVTAAEAPCWRAPVHGWIIDPFREPPCPWCAGNRGIEYGVNGTQPVRAVSGGVVTFAGSVAGTRYVVVEHVDGWKATYGKLDTSSVIVGDGVARGAVLGAARRTFFFSLRVDDSYRDPWPYLGELRGRPRLIPIDGSAARPSPAPSLVCGS